MSTVVVGVKCGVAIVVVVVVLPIRLCRVLQNRGVGSTRRRLLQQSAKRHMHREGNDGESPKPH